MHRTRRIKPLTFGLLLLSVGILHLLVVGLVALGSLASIILSLLRSPFGLGFLQSGLSLGFNFLEMALDNGTSHGADLVDLGDVNTLSVKIQASTYLSGLKLGLDGLLLVLASELGVLLIELRTEIVDIGLELVLLLLGIGDKLVLHDHGGLLLKQTGLGGVIQRGAACRNGQVTLANLLLHLAGLLRSILISLHGLLGSGC
ncbi:hypothetical protein HG530_000027 [Fusarium avenaceum]|nr:hypothetical protein HG530_000027 [Fusarium avenaceum]